MQREHFLFVPEVSLILLRDDRVFLLRRQNTGYEDGKFCFIAGHKEQGETVKQGIIREAKEEADIDITEDHMQFVQFMHRKGDHERASFFFTVSEYEGEPRNAEPEKCSECGWYALDSLPEMMSYHHAALDHYLAGHIYADFGWEEALSLAQ